MSRPDESRPNPFVLSPEGARSYTQVGPQPQAWDPKPSTRRQSPNRGETTLATARQFNPVPTDQSRPDRSIPSRPINPVPSDRSRPVRSIPSRPIDPVPTDRSRPDRSIPSRLIDPVPSDRSRAVRSIPSRPINPVPSRPIGVRTARQPHRTNVSGFARCKQRVPTCPVPGPSQSHLS